METKEKKFGCNYQELESNCNFFFSDSRKDFWLQYPVMKTRLQTLYNYWFFVFILNQFPKLFFDIIIKNVSLLASLF